MKAGLLIITFLVAGSSASAAFTPQQLLKLTQNPTSIKPTQSGNANVNSGVSAKYWQWGDPLKQGVELTRLNGNPAIWQLVLSTQVYTAAKIAPQRQLLATITDPIAPAPVDLYLIKGGVFTGNYMVEQRFDDGSRNLSIITRNYAITAARGSELQQGEEGQIYSYPLGTFLLYKSDFCSVPGAVCR